MKTIESLKSKNLAIMNTVLSSNLFAFVAKTSAWPQIFTPKPEDIFETDFNEEICFLKLLTGKNLRLMVKYTNWAAGSFELDSFILTEDNNIYRCISAGTSGQKPNHQSGNLADLDGTAIWEFAEHLTPADKSLFSNSEYVSLSLACERYIYKDLVKAFGVSYDIVGDEDSFLPLTTQFRVTGLYANPFDRYSRTNTSEYKDKVKDYGFVLTWTTLAPSIRTFEQIDSYTFFIDLN